MGRPYFFCTFLFIKCIFFALSVRGLSSYKLYNKFMNNTERTINELKEAGFSEEEAEEIFDYYLSIDCIDNLNIIALVNKISSIL